MKRLESVKNDTVEMEVIECDCGYHMGVDASYIMQVGDFVTICPSCKSTISTKKILNEDEDETWTNNEMTNNEIQFPRFIAEAQMAGAFTDEVLKDMATSMDLEMQYVCDLMDRACDVWDEVKNRNASDL